MDFDEQGVFGVASGLPGGWGGGSFESQSPPSSSTSMVVASQQDTSRPTYQPARTQTYEGGGIFSDIEGPPDPSEEPEEEDAPAPMYARELPPFPNYSQPVSLLHPPSSPSPMYVSSGQSFPVAMRGTVDTQPSYLGASILLTALGAGVGAYYGGAWGAGAGASFGGAATSAFKAYKAFRSAAPDANREAVISGTFSLIGLGIGAALWHYLVVPRKGTMAYRPNQTRQAVGDDDCGLRRVGP